MGSEILRHLRPVLDIRMLKTTTDRKLIARRITSALRLPPGLIRTTLIRMREEYRSVSLRFKIAFFVVILMTCTSFGLSIITVQIMNSYLQNEIIKRGESVGKSIAASAGYSLLSRDLLGLDNLVYKAKSSNNDMEYVAYRHTGQQSHRSQRDGHERKHLRRELRQAHSGKARTEQR